MKTITYTAAADKALNAMPAETAARIEAKIERYAETGEGDVKALKGSPALRLRVGDYRVIFTETFEVLSVEHIGHRREIYL